MSTATPALALTIGHGMAEMPSRRLEAFLRRAHRRPPSRSTIERLGKWIGGGVKQDVLVLEEIVRVDELLPEGAHAIAVGLDRTSVPMAEERPPHLPPSSSRRPRRTPHKRRPPHPFDVVYRMAFVGTVSVVDAHGEALVTRKYAATVEEGMDELVHRVMADVQSLRRSRALDVIVVQDGAPEIWRGIEDGLRAAGIETWYRLIDRFHVTQRMAAILEQLIRNPDERRAEFDRWRARLDRDDRGVQRFVDWVERRTKSAAAGHRIRTHVNYLWFNADCRMTRYATAIRKGFPIASGVTEGACKSLVGMRAKGSGQRWQQDGLTAILTLRALVHSDRFDQLWPHFAKRFRADINDVQ